MQHAAAAAARLSDHELLIEIARVVSDERAATTRLVAALAELDARKLYLGEGCSSLFTYCTQVLHLSEHAAYGRIEAARAARKWPLVLDLLADGAIHLTAVTLLAPHLTTENHRDVLAAARHKSKRQVEEIVAALRPQPPVPSSVRKLPAPRPAPSAARPATTGQLGAPTLPACPTASEPPRPASAAVRPAAITPLAPALYKVQFTVSRETQDKLRQAQDLLRHRIPNGDVAAIFDRALTLLLAELRRTKHAATERPRALRLDESRRRYVPAAVKREVWERDGGRCAFVGAAGRCTERGCLEHHHVVPFADGGATTPDNLELRCRAHNVYEAERWFGVADAGLVRERAVEFGAGGRVRAVSSPTPRRPVGCRHLCERMVQDGLEQAAAVRLHRRELRFEARLSRHWIELSL